MVVVGADGSDLIATGGSAAAAGELIRKAGGKTLEYLFVVGLPFLKGADKVSSSLLTGDSGY